jgi:formylglycine-generating enzyme required for sulfatase activity
VLRGGSWNNNLVTCRLAYRNNNHPVNAHNTIGSGSA